MISASKPGRAGMRTLALLACVAAVTGCSTIRGWFGGKDDPGKPNEPTELTDFTPTANLTRLWSQGAGDGEGRLGVRQLPAIADNRVYAAAIEGGVRAFDLVTGQPAWSYRSDLRLSGGPGAGDGLVVVGGLDGEVIALDAATGAEKWQAKVTNEVIAPPVIGNGFVFVRSNDGRVTAFDAATGERRWFWTRDVPLLSVRGNDAPLLGPGFLFVGNDDGSVVALSASDGRPLWEQAVAQPEGRTELERMADIDGTPALDGTVLYATSYKGQTMAIDGPTGRPMWVAQQGGAGRVGVAPDRVVVTDRTGNVYALEKNGGSTLWMQPGLARRSVTGAAIHGDYAVVGDFDGYLHWLRLDTGEFAARARVGRDPIRANPVVVGDILVVQTTDGEVAAYRLQ